MQSPEIMLCGHRARIEPRRNTIALRSSNGAASATWRVFNGRMPLAGMERVASALKGTPLQQLLQLHTYTLLQGPDEAWYFDYLPLRPTAPDTALLLLTGSRAPGEVRVRRLGLGILQRDYSARLQLVGPCNLADPLAAARQFNAQFDTGLHLLHNNCTHHTKGLTQLLLGGNQD